MGQESQALLAEFEAWSQASSMDELRVRFGTYLGLDGPVPEDVLTRAIEDQDYRHNLILCRQRPELLRWILEDDKTAQWRENPTSEDQPRSDATLVAQAGMAMVRWGMSGFTRVDDETFAARMAACQACPNLTEPPDTALYKLATVGARDRRVCNACGCVVSRKARLPREACPVVDPDDPTRNRWGQPRRHTG